MKKILETQEGRLGKIVFSDEKGIGIQEGTLENFMKKMCEIYSERGVIVHMTKGEYECFEKIQNGGLVLLDKNAYEEYEKRFAE